MRKLVLLGLLFLFPGANWPSLPSSAKSMGSSTIRITVRSRARTSNCTQPLGVHANTVTNPRGRVHAVHGSLSATT